VTRDLDGEIYAFENRCALICLGTQGKGKKDFSWRGSNVGHTWRRVGAARGDEGLLNFSVVVRLWIDALVRRRDFPRASERTSPFWRWRDRRGSAIWRPCTG
jgi:hypothetical protein